jgi:hypothetical protein
MSEFCYILYSDGTAHTASANSLMEAGSIALRWIEEDRKTARILQDSDILEIRVGAGEGRRYRVRVARVRAWQVRRRRF